MDFHSAYITVTNGVITPLLVSASATLTLVFVLIFLFFVSFVIAGSEIAFFSLNTKDINVIKGRQQPSYRRVVGLLQQPKTLLGAILITNSFVNMAIILISNLLLDNWLSMTTLSFWGIFTVKVISVTVFIVLFAEVLPRVWATHHKIWFASSASLMVEIVNTLFFNVSKRLVQLNDNAERRFSKDKQGALHSSHLDEAIDLLPDNEASSEEKQILKGIRKFGDTEVKHIMHTRMDVSGIEYASSFGDVLKSVQQLHYSRLPVYKNNLDEPAGMLHTKDLLPHLHEPENFDWHPLIRAAYFVHEQKLIEDLLQEFRNKRNHFAIVVDEFGGTSGIVTLEDIMEEIIGEIKDEFDDEESINKKLDDYNYIFEGRMMINDALKAMELPSNTFDSLRGDSDSVAGLVLEIAGEFPAVGSTLIHGNFSFIPLEINKNRIDKVKITINPKPENS